MSLPTGSFIGPYEIAGWLGSGGMGVVYRAHDSRLGREVAIKFLPEALATDVERVDRFEQEARAAGQVNHPNILAVFDVGTHAGAPYIVSELLEGESLRRHLAGGALSMRRAIEYARQAALGLGAAHDRAIVHRDVKPDNLFITSDGRVKVLDFGVAKLMRPGDDGPGSRRLQTDTEPGVVLGTATYMSPEQVRGEAVDTRSDIFSLGAVLHEMLTGQPPFSRETVAETMTAILKEEPAPLPATVPPAVERIVSRCLEKTRDERYHSARDLAFGLDGLTGTSANASMAVPGAPQPRRLRPVVPWAVAGALALGLAALAIARAPKVDPQPPAALRLRAELGADAALAPLNAQFGDATAISPDGSLIAFVAEKGDSGRPQLYVRRLDQLQAVALSGTDGALAPFFSPDGRWIGFFANFALKKIAVTGGAAVTLAEAPSPRGGSWAGDDEIVFTPNQLPGTRLMRVPSSGSGAAVPAASLSDDEAIQAWPQVLPGGQVLYTSGGSVHGYNDANLVVRPLTGGAPTVVQRGGYHGRYVESGHLLYMHDGNLLAAPFDLGRLEVTGSPVAVLDAVASNSITGGAQFAVSASGTAVYLPGPMVGGGTPLDWMTRDGRLAPLRPAPANWFSVRVSPDGRRLAMDIRDGQSDIWIYEWARDSLRRLTLDPADDTTAIWTPDGQRIAFASTRADQLTSNIYWQRADGSGEVERLTHSPHTERPGAWHPSGRWLAFEETTTPSNVDVMILHLAGDAATGWTAEEPRAFLNSAALEAEPAFSPDGRWLAYVSNESGRPEVYVRPFPGPGDGTKWLVSNGGGEQPTWSQSKPEIFYGSEGQVMVAEIRASGTSFRSGRPHPWAEGRYQTRGPNRMFDLHPDGERVALAPAAHVAGRSNPDSVVLIVNFLDELRRVAVQRRR